jgi:translation initiation factor 2A
VRDSQNFIVLAGRQPAVATLYDKNCTALFEFGKRFRNTIRICPFSQLAMIGGFGNLPGEMDFWDLKNLKQIGKAKSHCAVA